jgi:hypothetical protein
MPVILATQRAEIKRMAVRSQPKPLVHETISQKNPSQETASEVALISNPSTAKTKKQKNEISHCDRKH